MAQADDMMMDRRSARIVRGAFTIGALVLAGLALAACTPVPGKEYGTFAPAFEAASSAFDEVCVPAIANGDTQAEALARARAAGFEVIERDRGYVQDFLEGSKFSRGPRLEREGDLARIKFTGAQVGGVLSRGNAPGDIACYATATISPNRRDRISENAEKTLLALMLLTHAKATGAVSEGFGGVKSTPEIDSSVRYTVLASTRFDRPDRYAAVTTWKIDRAAREFRFTAMSRSK